MLIKILQRANQLFDQGHDLFASPYLKTFLQKRFTVDDFKNNTELLDQFALIDDNDVLSAIKTWQFSDDKILSILCKNIVSRKLFKTEITKEPADANRVDQIKTDLIKQLDIDEKDVHYFMETEILVNNAYNEKFKQILIIGKTGKIQDIAMASDNLNISALSQPVEKFCLCYHSVKMM
jgi:hypothetical protein